MQLETEVQGEKFTYDVVPRDAKRRSGVFIELPDDQRGYWDARTLKLVRLKLVTVKRECETLSGIVAKLRARVAPLLPSATADAEKASRVLAASAACFGRCLVATERVVELKELHAIFTQGQDAQQLAQEIIDRFNIALDEELDQCQR